MELSSVGSVQLKPIKELKPLFLQGFCQNCNISPEISKKLDTPKKKDGSMSYRQDFRWNVAPYMAVRAQAPKTHASSETALPVL